MKHLHHIVPRHMNGSDDSSNLVELTVEEHAQAHLDLYHKYGKEEEMSFAAQGRSWRTDPMTGKRIFFKISRVA